MSETSFAVTFTRAGVTTRCRSDEFVLAAGEAAGIALPYSCREGACGTCKSKLVSGQVQMNHKGGIRQREIDRGLILICCSHPLSDLVIEEAGARAAP
jgi:glycine betaine catabolism B